MPIGSRKYVSIGGWCGPALILGKLGLRTEAYPLDFSRCTLDGVIHFIRNGFGNGFYPPGPLPYLPECVGQWVLYRGQHTAFAHFDLNDVRVQSHFERKIARFNSLLDQSTTGVTFLRTVTARHPAEELALAWELETALLQRNPSLNFRVVFIVHDQGLRARSLELHPLSPRMTLWALQYTADDTHTLFDRSLRGYTDIVMHSIEESHWPAAARDAPIGYRPTECDYEGRCVLTSDGVGIPFEKLTAAAFPWRSHHNLALIDGVASVGGSCTGVGSTRMLPDPRTGQPLKCFSCGDATFHRANRPKAALRPFTEEEDGLLLTHLYRILTGMDKVEAVEEAAHELGRGSLEVICRIQHITGSSTKLMDYVKPDGGEDSDPTPL